ncbi:hypothetical protein HDV02_004894 [Globomyces sp. JEL0801]|nr:hypothetical protein HDV02_004894 [Globomyces sp. JEL0801]
MTITGSWDKSIKLWDDRNSDPLMTTLEQTEKVFSLDVCKEKMVVALANRIILVYDLRNTSTPLETKESNLKYMTRKIACIPNGKGYATSSIEGRGGRMDGLNKKRLRQYPAYPTSISSLSFNCDGTQLAVASSYTFEEGEKEMGKPKQTNELQKDKPVTKKYNQNVHKKESKQPSNSVIKKKIRDVRRLLTSKGDNLSATKKVELERSIKALEQQIISNGQLAKETKLKEKYQYIKFVEEKKTRRRLKQVNKTLEDLSETDDTYLDLKKEFNDLEFNLKYIRFYPVDIKYISLYPSNVTEENEVQSNDIKSKVIELIKKADEDGLLVDDAVLRLNTKIENDDDLVAETKDENDDFFL